MARYRSRRTVVFAGCLVSCVLYLLTAYHYQTLSLSGSWSGSAVKRVRSWEGHRQLSLLIVVPAVCGENLVPTSEDRCLQHISRACRDFSSRGCIIKKGVGQSDACEQTLLHQKGSSDIKHALFTPFRRVLPHLKELGWTQQQVLQQDSRNLGSAIRHADIVVCSLQIYQMHRSTSHFIIIDESLTGQLDLIDLGLLQNPQILAVLKPHIVTTSPQRRQTYRPLAGPQKKVHALIPLLWLWAFPLDCGSNLSYMRYTGFFQPQLAGWDRSKLWQRPVDVVLLTSNAAEGSPGHAHYQLAAYEVRKLKERIPGLNVITQLADNYDEFLDRNLMDAKVVVSVLQPISEVSLQDYEAWLAGCALVKPRAQDIQAYPNAFQSGYTVHDVSVDFSNLGDVVVGILQNLVAAQKMVDRVTAMLKKHGKPAQFAMDLDELLELSVKESMSLE